MKRWTADALARAVERELARRIAERGVAPDAPRRVDVERVEAKVARTGDRGAPDPEVGALAGAIHARIGGGERGR